MTMSADCNAKALNVLTATYHTIVPVLLGKSIAVWAIECLDIYGGCSVRLHDYFA